MAKEINPDWVKKKRQEIETGKFRSVVLSYNAAAQWLITFLSEKDIPIEVTHMGAGVKRITIAKNVCPTCKGKGYVDKEG